MFEASVYIDWMLAGDRENKAAYYYVHNLLRLRLWEKYVEKWQRAFVNIPELKIDEKDLGA